jgi:hypothetical protein
LHPPGCWPRTGDVGRTRFGNRARVVGLACSPRMQTPSSTTKLLAGMPASKAAAERVFYLKENLNIPSQIADSGLGHGQCFRARGSASGREIAARGQSGRSIHRGLVFLILGKEAEWRADNGTHHTAARAFFRSLCLLGKVKVKRSEVEETERNAISDQRQTNNTGAGAPMNYETKPARNWPRASAEVEDNPRSLVDIAEARAPSANADAHHLPWPLRCSHRHM